LQKGDLKFTEHLEKNMQQYMLADIKGKIQWDTDMPAALVDKAEMCRSDQVPDLGNFKD